MQLIFIEIIETVNCEVILRHQLQYKIEFFIRSIVLDNTVEIPHVTEIEKVFNAF